MKITLQELLEMKNKDRLMPFDIINEETNDIWFYDEELGDYWNEIDDRLLLKDEKDFNKCFTIQEFVAFSSFSGKGIEEIMARLDFLSSKVDKLLNKLN